MVADSWSGYCVAVGHSSVLGHVVDIGVLKSKSAVIAEVLNVFSQELLWLTRLEVASVLESYLLLDGLKDGVDSSRP